MPPSATSREKGRGSFHRLEGGEDGGETPMVTTLTQAFLETGGIDTRGVGFYDRKGDVTAYPYARIVEESLRVAGALRALGVRPGDRIGIVLPTSIDFLLAFFGSVLAGGVPFALPTIRLGRLADYHDRTTRMMRAVGVTLVLTDDRHDRLLGPSITAAAPLLGHQSVLSLLAASPGPIAPEAPAPETPAMIQFSSGTTVDPKPVILTHRNLVTNVQAIVDAFPEPHAELSTVSWLPLYHDMGLIGALFATLLARLELTLLKTEDFILRPILWLRALSDRKGRISPAPTSALEICLRRIGEGEMAGIDLRDWRFALIGSERVHAPTLARFAERFAGVGFRKEAFMPVYGLAEATLAVTFPPPERGMKTLRVDPEALARSGEVIPLPDGREIVSTGAPIADNEIEIRGEKGSPLGEDRLGRIFVRGASVMEGYFGNDTATAEAIRQGWLDTGDLGFLHEGELYPYDRAKDILILFGQNHDPSAIEAAIRETHGLEAAAFARFDEASGKEILEIAVEVAPKACTPLLAEGVREAVIRKTGLQPGAIHLLTLGMLPRTSSGKVRRSTLKRELEGGAITPRYSWRKGGE
ncbi:MAG: fatty acyl-AMP ligase [Deltaproteobacteria bacterium]|nr:MAG: fatty acyl-AMP ligase [Deltaproteobacteria bacterium]